MKRLYYLDKTGRSVKTIKGRWFLNFLRRLIYTRRITFKRPGGYLPITDYYKLVDSLITIPMEQHLDFVEGCLEHAKKVGDIKDPTNPLLDDIQEVTIAAYANLQKSHTESLISAGYSSEPNALTRRVLEESERGENTKSFDTVEELFEDLDRDD